MHERHTRSFQFNRCPVIHPVIFYDDCEGTFHYQDAGDGADYVAEYSNAHALVGNKSIKLATRATGPTSGDQVSITKSLWLSPHKILNLTAALARTSDAGESLDFLLTWHDGTDSHAAGLRLSRINYRVWYLNSGATYTSLGNDLWNPVKTPFWNKVRLSIDLASNRYVSLVVNHQLFDLSAISFAVSATGTRQALELSLVATSGANAIGVFHVDQLLLRGDNP